MTDATNPDPTSVELTPFEVGCRAAVAADDKLADDVIVLDVAAAIGICDVFVIASARNARQVKAVAEEVEAQLALIGRRPSATEGLDSCGWVLIDYGDVVVHIFLDTEREYYRLERLYADCERIDWRAETGAGRSDQVV